MTELIFEFSKWVEIQSNFQEQEDYKIPYNGFVVSFLYSENTITLGFNSEEDATMFKLTWL